MVTTRNRGKKRSVADETPEIKDDVKKTEIADEKKENEQAKPEEKEVEVVPNKQEEDVNPPAKKKRKVVPKKKATRKGKGKSKRGKKKEKEEEEEEEEEEEMEEEEEKDDDDEIAVAEPVPQKEEEKKEEIPPEPAEVLPKWTIQEYGMEDVVTQDVLCYIVLFLSEFRDIFSVIRSCKRYFISLMPLSCVKLLNFDRSSAAREAQFNELIQYQAPINIWKALYTSYWNRNFLCRIEEAPQKLDNAFLSTPTPGVGRESDIFKDSQNSVESQQDFFRKISKYDEDNEIWYTKCLELFGISDRDWMSGSYKKISLRNSDCNFKSVRNGSLVGSSIFKIHPDREYDEEIKTLFKKQQTRDSFYAVAFSNDVFHGSPILWADFWDVRLTEGGPMARPILRRLVQTGINCSFNYWQFSFLKIDDETAYFKPKYSIRRGDTHPDDTKGKDLVGFGFTYNFRTQKSVELDFKFVDFYSRRSGSNGNDDEERIFRNYSTMCERMHGNGEYFDYDGNLFIFHNVFNVVIMKVNHANNKLEKLFEIDFGKKSSEPKKPTDIFSDADLGKTENNLEFVLFARLVDKYETLSASNDAMVHTKSLVIITSLLNAYSIDLTNLEKHFEFSTSEAPTTPIKILFREYPLFDDLKKVIQISKHSCLTEKDQRAINDEVEAETSNRNYNNWGFFQSRATIKIPRLILAECYLCWFNESEFEDPKPKEGKKTDDEPSFYYGSPTPKKKIAPMHLLNLKTFKQSTIRVSTFSSTYDVIANSAKARDNILGFVSENKLQLYDISTGQRVFKLKAKKKEGINQFMSSQHYPKLITFDRNKTVATMNRKIYVFKTSSKKKFGYTRERFDLKRLHTREQRQNRNAYYYRNYLEGCDIFSDGELLFTLDPFYDIENYSNFELEIDGSHLITTLSNGLVSIFAFGKSRKNAATAICAPTNTKESAPSSSKQDSKTIEVPESAKKNVDTLHGFAFGSLVFARTAINQSFGPGQVLACARLTNKDMKNCSLSESAKTDVVKLLIQFFKQKSKSAKTAAAKKKDQSTKKSKLWTVKETPIPKDLEEYVEKCPDDVQWVLSGKDYVIHHFDGFKYSSLFWDKKMDKKSKQEMDKIDAEENKDEIEIVEEEDQSKSEETKTEQVKKDEKMEIEKEAEGEKKDEKTTEEDINKKEAEGQKKDEKTTENQPKDHDKPRRSDRLVSIKKGVIEEEPAEEDDDVFDLYEFPFPRLDEKSAKKVMEIYDKQFERLG